MNIFKSYNFLLFLALVILLQASCSKNSNDGKVLPPIIDPGPDAIRQEVSSLPFKHVIWDYKFDNEIITRITLGYEHLFVETQSNRIYAIKKLDGYWEWMFEVDTNTPLEFPPVESLNLPAEIIRLEKEEDKLTALIEDEKKKIGPDPERIKELQEKVDLAKTEEERTKWQKELDEERNRKGINLKRIEELINELKNKRAQIYAAKKLDRVYLYSKGTLYCIWRKFGRLLWRNAHLGFTPSATPVAAPAYVFIPSIEFSRVFQLDVEKRGEAVTYYKAEGSSLENEIANPPLYDGSLYFMSRDGSVYCYDVEKKKLMENWPYKTMKKLKADPILHKYRYAWVKDGKPIETELIFLFIGGMDLAFHALDAKGGNLLWKYDISGVVTTPAIAKDATVYFKTDNGYFYALNVMSVHKDEQGNFVNKVGDESIVQWKKTGELRWKKPHWEHFLVKGKNKVYCLAPDNEIYAVDEMSGEIKGCYKIKYLDFLLTNTLDGTFYCATKSGYIFALKESASE